MGWKGAKTTIPVGMMFRNMHCHKCGTRLRKEKVSTVYRKGDEGYSNKILGHSTIGMTAIEKSFYVYRCPRCDTTVTYDEQCRIAKRQKLAKQTVLAQTDTDRKE